ncbi:MAG: patatin family protein [Lachnospiraceae bacterium]|nr:patatin family protein [Lachnospiraceae bacterium]
MINAGLVLEGGALRGVFTAGVLDYLMEQKVAFHYVIGVSAGSCNAVDYVSGQIGRTRDCFIPKDKEERYLSPWNLFKGKALYDMDKVFVEYPDEIYPFDFKAYFASPMRCEIVTTNCLTGKAEYMHEEQERAMLMNICRASSSLPLVSPMVMLHNVPYLDGGLSDSIPIARSIHMGNEKNVVILTRNAKYRKKLSSKTRKLYQRYFREYPELTKTILNRSLMYNKQMDYIDELEEKGKVFVIRPEVKVVSKVEMNSEKLVAFYQHGYDVMNRDMDKLMKYLKEV